MSDNLNSFYVGIVIQNNDPDKRGRCKIFIPHVTTYLTDDWLNDSSKNRSFKFINGQASEDLLEILPGLKQVLPWANYAGPIFGGNSSGRFNATTKQGYIEDHNDWIDGSPATVQRPSSEFNNASPPKDAFTDPSTVNVTNPYAYAYTPSDYSTLASGTFSIPNVGAHVWCFFEGGDVDCPVYFAGSYGTEDIKRVYTTNKHTTDTVLLSRGEEEVKENDVAIDYPGTYENIEQQELDDDAKIFRSKHTINSNKHTIEMIDTDKHEILKFSHYGGAFKEFTNQSNIEFAPFNDQKLVLGNQFETIRQTQNIHVEDDKNVYVFGDSYETIGDYDFAVTQRIKTIMDSIHTYIQLFDIRRTNTFQPGAEIPNPNPELVETPIGAEPGNIYAANLPNLVSPLQTREKKAVSLIDTNDFGFAVCPLCKNEPYLFNEEVYLQELQPRIFIGSNVILSEEPVLCNDYFTQDSLKVQGSVRLPLLEYSPFDLDVADKLRNLQDVGFYAGAKCDICNSDLLLTPTKLRGYSPSSQGGDFEEESRKQPGGELDQILENAGPALIELERQLRGGDKITSVNRNKIETIGTVMNDLPALRVDPVGKLRAENVYVAPDQVYQSYRPSPHVEPVTVMDVPGGDYIITATNKYKLIVGANGINIKTFGNIDVYGNMIDIAGQQLNISSQYETTIDGGERLSLRARKIAVTPREHSPVLVDGALHVSRNAIVQGGMYVNGQFGAPAIASLREYGESSDAIWAPAIDADSQTETNEAEVQVDEDGNELVTFDKLRGKRGRIQGNEIPDTQPGTTNTWSYVACGMTAPIPPGGSFPGIPEGVPVTVLIPPHTHLYERPPSQLFNSLQALRMFFADPNGVPVASGGDSASINDVRRMTAATPVNDTATGEARLSVVDYRDIIRGKITSYINSNAEWATSGGRSVTVNILDPTNFIEEKTKVQGYLSVSISTTSIRRRQIESSQTYIYSIFFVVNIDPITSQFISEAEDPVVTQTSGPARSIGL